MAITQQEREDANARMLELYGYSLDDCEAVGYKAHRRHKNGPKRMPTTAYGLQFHFGSYVLASRKSKGAGRGYKETYRWQWADRRGYMNQLRELFPKEYALQLCRDEHAFFMGDRWWDADGYREGAIKDYRARIRAIRQEHGLSKSEAAEFMRVAEPSAIV